MTFKQKHIDDVFILALRGKMRGGSDTIEIHNRVKSLIEKNIKKVVIDLSKIKWMNSQGLGMLISCLTSLNNAGGALKIAGVTDKVNSLFMITKLITVFETYETVDHAVASFKQ